MNNVTRFLTAIAFSVAGAAAHANAAVEQNACGSSTCFQLTPVAGKGGDAFARRKRFQPNAAGQVAG